MKKWILLLLCLAMLLLPACQKNNVSIDLPTGSDGDYVEWNRFIWACKREAKSDFVMLRDKADGSKERVTVTYDGESYAITDDSGTRTYSYLISDTYVEKSGDGYSYGDYFFLTNDANMTFEKYRSAQTSPLNDYMQLLLPTELVLAKVDIFDEVQGYGTVPEQIQPVVDRLAKESPIYFGKDSFFTLDFVTPYFVDHDPEALGSFHLNRYDYAGEQLCSIDIPHRFVTAISEFEDGGFCFFIRQFDDVPAQIFYYNANGDLRWSYSFSGEQDIHISYIFRTNDYFYCFGTKSAANSDIYIGTFTSEGQLAKEMSLGGSGFDSLHHVVSTANGFTLYGSTESNDGSFPFSQDGNSVFFKADLSSDMTLSASQMLENNPYDSSPCGFIGDQQIFKNDALLTAKDTDRLPESTDVVAVFTWDDGYVVLRQCQFAQYNFVDPGISTVIYYRQFIATYYNGNGEPIWQTISEPYLG